MKLDVNAIYCGDCLELMPRFLPDNSIDMICCDLPYGTTKCSWDSRIDLERLWSEYKRVIKASGAIVLFAQTPFDKVLGVSNLKMLRYEWIWEKGQATGHLNAKKMPMKCHENILVFYKELPTYNPQKTFGNRRVVSTSEHRRNSKDSSIYGGQKQTTYDSTERYPRSVQFFSRDTQRSKLHPTQKPIGLIKYLIKTYTHEGDLVLDNCCGSGTTGVAAKLLNRNYVLMENDIKMYKVACERLNYKQMNG